MATIDAHKLLHKYDYLDEYDAAYLLRFHSPLEMIAETWAEYFENGWSDFEQAICDVLDDEDNEDLFELEHEYRERALEGVEDNIIEIRAFLREIGKSAGRIEQICNGILEEEFY